MDKICLPLISDRAAKANFGTVDPADMLERVRSLPITTWNYRSDDPAVRYIGPMAQDFTAAFGVGRDERTIYPMDGQGVALAAIQGLADQVTALQAEQQRPLAQQQRPLAQQQRPLAQVATLEARCRVTDPA